ncbi:hypothetical protein ACWY2R_07045 [Enterococcus avium]
MKKVKYGSKEYPTIGGAPQLIKLYQHMNAQPIGIFWSEDRDTMKNKEELRKNGEPNILGRYILDYENTDFLFMDAYSEESKLLPNPNIWDFTKDQLPNEDVSTEYKGEKDV